MKQNINIWTTPDIFPELGEAAVHVWQLDLMAVPDPKSCMTDFSQEELARAESTKYDTAFRQFVLTRYALRSLLGHYLAVAPNSIFFDKTPSGKPFLRTGNGAAPLVFNVAHSHERTLLAIAQTGLLGVDVEHVNTQRDALKVAQRFFAHEEIAAMEELDAQERIDRFYALWTGKEAYVKALGEGLRFALDNFTLKQGDDALHLTHTERSGPSEKNWTLRHIPLDNHYVGACATTIPTPEFLFCHYSFQG